MTIAALDLGGTHVSAAAVDPESGEVSSVVRVDHAPDAERDELLGGIREAARAVAGPAVVAVGVAAPGPFDYERGICLVRGLAKLEALFGVDLRQELAAVFALPGEAVVFLNDAEAFLLGEAAHGAAAGVDRAIGITLGTGLGSAFIAGGRLVRNGPGIPPDGELHVVEFRGAPVEDRLSARGLLARAAAADVRELAGKARAGDNAAHAVFTAFGAGLAEFLGPWAEAFRAGIVVAGGSISRAWDLFGTELERGLPVPVVPARHLDKAPLLGAAEYARLSRSAQP